MRKFLAILLALCMLTAIMTGCNKDKADVQEPEKETTGKIEETDEPEVVPVSKKEYYSTYFSSPDFGYFGNTISASSNEINVKIVDNETTGLFSMGIKNTLFEVYKTKEGTQYIHVVMPETEEGPVDVWYNYKDETSEEDIFNSMVEDTTMTDVALDVNGMKDIEYVETIDGVDKITALLKNTEFDPSVSTSNYNIKFNYNGTECTMSISYTTGNGITSSYMYNVNAPEEFNETDYTVDFENNSLIYTDGNKIAFEVVDKSDIANDEYYTIELGIDEETHRIVYMTQTLNGITATVKFEQTEINLNIPENTEPCNAEEFAMLYLAVMFSMVDF